MLKSISTFSLFNQRNETLRSLEADMARALQESSTTKKSDLAGDLGVEISILNELRSQKSTNASYLSAIDSFDRRSEFMASALNAVNDGVNSLVKDVVLNTPQAGDAIGALNLAAQAAIDLIADTLNVNADGRFLFSGVDLNVSPLRSSDELNPGSGLSPNNVIAGILDGTAYGPPLPPAFSPAFTAAEAADAIARFNAVFDGTNAALPLPTQNFSFENTFYDGAVGGPAISARVSDGAPVDYGVSAENEAFRKVLQGAYMIASADLQEMAGTDAYEPYVTAALDLLTSGLDDIRSLNAELGAVQVDMAARRETIGAQGLVLDLQINAYELVDPIETQSLVNEIDKQLEAAYAATVRATRLRLTNFL